MQSIKTPRLVRYFSFSHLNIWPMYAIPVILVITGWLSIARYGLDNLNTGPDFSPLAILLPLLLSVATARYCDAKRLATGKAIAFQLGAALLGVLLYILCISQPSYQQMPAIILMAGGAITLTLAAPAIAGIGQQQFWLNLMQTLLQAAIGIAFAGIFYLALALAYKTTGSLFGFKTYSRVYTQAAYFIFFLLYPLYVLSRISSFSTALPQLPLTGTLRFLVNNILLPILALYFAIIAVYYLRILFTLSLPNGEIGYLCFGFAALGIVAWYINRHLPAQTQRRLPALINRYFWLGLLIVLPVHVLAMFVRVNAFGITPERYMGLAVQAWLLVCTLYYLLAGQPRLQALLLFASGGLFLLALPPLQPDSVTIRSQLNFLARNLSATNEGLQHEKAERLEYLCRHYGNVVLQQNHVTRRVANTVTDLKLSEQSKYPVAGLFKAFNAQPDTSTSKRINQSIIITTPAAAALSVPPGALIIPINSNYRTISNTVHGNTIVITPTQRDTVYNVQVNGIRLTLSSEQLQPALVKYAKTLPIGSNTGEYTSTQSFSYSGQVQNIRFAFYPTSFYYITVAGTAPSTVNNISGLLAVWVR